jgi:DNA-binding transcriptional MerR regulator
MRIGELAGIVGITTRAVRHYHRIGLLPEPARQPNGYREYGLRDAVELARIRRLSELGLSLDEVRDVVAADAGRELVEILGELDADLARQEAAIRERRARLGRLLEQAERCGGRLPAEAPVSPELAAIFDDMARTSAQLPGPEPAMAAKERELLALLETDTSPEGRRHREWFDALGKSLSGDGAAMRRAYEVYAQMDALAEADVDDPRVEETARAIVDSMPEEAVRAVTRPEVADAARESGVSGAPGASGLPGTPGVAGDGFAEAFFAEFAPAQAAAVRRAIALITERAR